MNYIKLSDGRLLESESELKEITKVELNKNKALNELNEEIENTEHEIDIARTGNTLVRIMNYPVAIVMLAILGPISPIPAAILGAVIIGQCELFVRKTNKRISGYKNKLNKIRAIMYRYKDEEDTIEKLKENEVFSYDEGLTHGDILSISNAYKIGYNKKKVKRYKPKHLK